MEKIPEINIKLTTVEVKGSSRPLKMTVRNMFYRGFMGKISTIWAWVKWHRHETFKEYLDSPVTYEIVPATEVECYHNIDAEEELKKLLDDEITDRI